MKVICGVVLLEWMPLAVPKNEKGYPKEKSAELVVEKLDGTSMPAAIRLKREKGKKTFGDYGYVTRKLDDKEAQVEAPLGHPQITISVLEENKSGIYACFNGRAQQPSGSPIQRVILLTLKPRD